MSKENLRLIDDLICTEEFCVLCTADGSQPHSSLMHFFADHAAMKFYFLSRRTTKKNRNIHANPHVSILIDRRKKGVALSIEGVYSPIRRGQTSEAIVRLYLLKHPELAELAADPDTELIRVEGRSATLSVGVDEDFHVKLKKS
jgi:uncharacterized protein YhbP (UPF0306 family)